MFTTLFNQKYTYETANDIAITKQRLDYVLSNVDNPALPNIKGMFISDNEFTVSPKDLAYRNITVNAKGKISTLADGGTRVEIELPSGVIPLTIWTMISLVFCIIIAVGIHNAWGALSFFPFLIAFLFFEDTARKEVLTGIHKITLYR